MAGDVEFTQELLGSRDLVRLVIDFDMSQHESGIDGKGAENLSRLSILEVVEAVPEGLAVQRDPALLRSPSGGVEPRSMAPKHRFDRRRIEPLKGVADRGVCWKPSSRTDQTRRSSAGDGRPGTCGCRDKKWTRSPRPGWRTAAGKEACRVCPGRAADPGFPRAKPTGDRRNPWQPPGNLTARYRALTLTHISLD